MNERFLPLLSIFFYLLVAYSEFFWIKVKWFSEFDFTAKFWVFKLKMPFRMAGKAKKALRHFFAQKMANEDVSLLFMRRQPLFTQNRRFSSLPRRNAMKPGHLHQTPEKPCLWSRFIPLTLHYTCEEVSLRCPWSCRLSAGGCVTLYCASLTRRQAALIFSFAVIYYLWRLCKNIG